MSHDHHEHASKWKHDGVRVIPGNTLDPNTAQTPGMDRKAAINFARVGAQKIWAGTVSGAPKVRAMEIIDELEKEKRGLYAGCVGYFSAAGELDSCIVLRTALVKDGKMYVQAGAGIVADSNPASEQSECINKATALFRAAEEARRFASADKRGQ